MPETNIAYTYNPANQTKSELIDGFVIRTRDFERIRNDIVECKLEDAPQHYLIEGQRGTGKTSLLLRLKYAIEDSDRSNSLIAIQFPEEQYGIYNLCKLWEKIADYLAEKKGFEEIEKNLEAIRDSKHYADECFGLIDEFLAKNDKRLVLLLDNFGDILQKLAERDHQRLRDILHSSKRLQIIGASSETLEHSYKYDCAFFEFFKKVRLGPLNKKESITLIKSLAERYGETEQVNLLIKNEPQRIEALRRLTGGMPRTLILLFQIFLDGTGEVFGDLEAILDKVTALYKHRMDDLKPQQQAIIDAIALSWDGISSKQIQDVLRDSDITSKKISSQLNALEQNDLVRSTKIDKKNKIYFIAERFFNIWYLMRYGRRKNREDVRWLVAFLREWCTPEEVKHRVERHLTLIREQRLHARGGYLMAQAMAEVSPELSVKTDLLRRTHSYLKVNEGELAGYLKSTIEENFKGAIEALERKAEEGESSAYIELARIQFSEFKNIKKCKEYLEQAVQLGDAGAMANLGYLYESEFKDFDKARYHYEQAATLGYARAMAYLANLYYLEFKDSDKARDYCEQAAALGDTWAMTNLGYLYESEFKDFDKARDYYEQAVALNDKEAMTSLGDLYFDEFKGFDKARGYYEQAVALGDARAMTNLGDLYSEEFKDFDKARGYYEQSVALGDTRAMTNLGDLYYLEFKDFDKASGYYEQAAALGDERAMTNLGDLYYSEFKDFDRARGYYEQAVALGDARAMTNLGDLYSEEFKDFDKARGYYEQSVALGDTRAMTNLGDLYYLEFKDFDKASGYYEQAAALGDERAMTNLGDLYYSEFKDFDRARGYYEQAAALGDERAMTNLGDLYYSEFKDFDRARGYYEQAVELGDERAMTNLGDLYYSESKDFDKARVYYEQGVALGGECAMNDFAWSLYSTAHEKGYALKLARDAAKIKPNDLDIQHTLASVALWNDEIEESLEQIYLFLNQEYEESLLSDLSDYFVLLLAKGQSHSCLKLFKEFPELKARIKPIYYAMLKLLGDEYEKEFKKMGEELAETVVEVLDKVEEYRVKYN